MNAVSMDEVIAETAAYHDLEEQDYIGFRCAAAGREIAAYLCRRWTGEPLSQISKRFGLSHPDSSSNLIRRVKKRMDESKDYHQAIDEIEYKLGLKTENQA